MNIPDTGLQTLIFIDYHPHELIYPTPDIRFPDLKDTLIRLIQKLSRDELDNLKFMDYPALFRNMDYSIQNMVDKAISIIEPKVLNFISKEEY